MQEARLELRLRVRHSRLLTLCTTLLEDRDFCMPHALLLYSTVFSTCIPILTRNSFSVAFTRTERYI